jgi:hypothetical protein
MGDKRKAEGRGKEEYKSIREKRGAGKREREEKEQAKMKQIGEEGKMWNKRNGSIYANERERNTVERE